MIKVRTRSVLIVCMFLLLFMAVSPKNCHADSGIKLNKKKATILVSKSINLTVKGTTSKVQWSSSDSSIAKVTAKGKVTGRKAGKAVITAKAGSKTVSCKVTVKIGLDKKSVILNVGESAKVKLCGTKIQKVQSADEKIASLDKKGVITAIGKGETTVTFTGKNKKKYKCKVTVNSITDQPKPTSAPSPVPAKTYVVTFDSNGGTSVSSQTIKAGEKASVPAIPTMDGYAFDHWEWNGVAYDFSAPVTSNRTLVAKWAKSTWENAEKVLQVIDAPVAPGVETEEQAIKTFAGRSFSDYEVNYHYSLSGEFCDDAKASDMSSAKRPMYNTYFVSNSGAVWTIYSVDGEIYAYPASYMLETNPAKEVLVSETDHITSYDDVTNKFFVTVPDPSKVAVKVVDRIDADTLNALTYDELGKL